MTKIPQVTSSKSLYKNKFLEIKVDTLALNNKEWEYAYFIKPNKNAAGILPIDNTGIYLVNQYRYPSGEYFWQIPMGMVEVGSSELDTAKKELLEETGITTKRLTFIGSINAEPGMSNQETFIYVGEDLSFGEKHEDENEIGMKLKHFTFAEIQEQIAKGAIKCGFTLSALMLLRNNYLNRVE